MFRHSRSRTCVRGLGLLLIVAAFGCRTNPEVAKQEYVKSGDRYVEDKKYFEAIVQYRNALQQDPKFGEARRKLAETYMTVGDAGNGFREYIRAADLLPDDVGLQVKAATLLLLAKQFEDAKTRAEMALDKDPKNVEAQIIRANALAGLNQFDSAIKQLEEANKLQPTVGGYGTIGAIESTHGSKPDAEKAFRAAVSVDPKNVNAHLALANYLISAGREADAEASFKQALALEPGNQLANRGLVAFYVANGRAVEAEPYLKKLAENDTSPQATYKIALAEYFAQSKRLGDAQKILAPLAASKEAFASSQTRLAAIQYAQKDTTKAHQTIDGVLQREPKNEEALLMKTRFLLAEGKLDDALKTAQAAVAANPQSAGGQYLVGTIERGRGRPAEAIAAFTEALKLNPRAVNAQLQLSQLNLATGRAETGLQFAEDAAKAQPRSPDIQLNLARNLIARNQLARADPIVRQLVKQYPDVAPAQAIGGTLALARKDYAQARQSYGRTLSLDPGNFEALAGLTSIDVAQKNFPQARSRLDAALAKDPSNVGLLLLSGRLSAAAGDLSGAEASFRKVIDVNPGALQAYGLLAQVYLSQKKLDQARAEFEQLAHRQAQAIGPPTMIAIIYGAQGKREESRRQYEKVLQIDDHAAVAANNLAYLYAEDGTNLDVALQLAQTAKSALPDAPEVDDTLGYVYVRKGLGSLAVPPLEASVQKDPKNPMLLLHLGQAYALTGEKAKAKRALEAALAISGSFEGAEEARKTLASLGS